MTTMKLKRTKKGRPSKAESICEVINTAVDNPNETDEQNY